MKISELQTKLATIKVQYGDIEVRMKTEDWQSHGASTPGCTGPVSEVTTTDTDGYFGKMERFLLIK